MNIHEYQAKELLKSFGVPVSKGAVVLDPKEAEAAAKSLPGPLYVVKAQIHAGGRGKGKFKEASAGEKGGVRLAKSPAEAVQFTREMLGATLVTWFAVRVADRPDARATASGVPVATTSPPTAS